MDQRGTFAPVDPDHRQFEAMKPGTHTDIQLSNLSSRNKFSPKKIQSQNEIREEYSNADPFKNQQKTLGAGTNSVGGKSGGLVSTYNPKSFKTALDGGLSNHSSPKRLGSNDRDSNVYQ